MSISFIKEEQYNQIKQLTSVKDVVNFLEEETDYANYMAIEAQNITVKLIKSWLKQKLADELDYIEENSPKEIQTLIQYIRNSYMIDNIINILEGIKNKVDLT